MHEEILPACERLRREKWQYMEWQAESAKLDSLRRFCIAHRYVQAQRLLSLDLQPIPDTSVRGANNHSIALAEDIPWMHAAYKPHGRTEAAVFQQSKLFS